MPTEEEMRFGLETLKRNDNKVDYIVTHCCPQRIASFMSNGKYEPDKLTEYFDDIDLNTEFAEWFFGHYHNDDRFLGKYTMLYHKIMRIL